MQKIEYQRRNNKVVNGMAVFDEPMVGEWIFLSGKLAIQITGNATAIQIAVERSVLDPTLAFGPNPAPVDALPIGGNPSTGMVPLGYFEPGSAWWRVRVLSISGGVAMISFSGPVGGDVVV